MPRYHITTFGCQMNKSDSERLQTILNNMRLEWVDDPELADLIVLNSCSVRESAESRIHGYVKNFANLKKHNPNLLIAVTGCMPGRDKKGALRRKLPEADLFFATKDMVELPKMLSALSPLYRDFENPEEDYLKLNPTYSSDFQAFLTIQTGCNMFCTYCVVPYARGLERNRPAADILTEARGMVDRGVIEITLLGQIVNHYVAPDPQVFSRDNPFKNNDFARLLYELNQIAGLERIHYTAPHPLYMDDEAIEALALPKHVNYLHLPMQSGSDQILARMNRRHNRDFYLDTITRLRNRLPNIALGTDIIVGFSGESEKDFEDTLDLYRRCDFDISYNAQYSVRSGTLGAKIYKDDVPKKEKKRRFEILQSLMEETTLRKNQKFLGEKISILVDSHENGFLTGNSREMKRARFKGGEDMVGKIVEAKVIKPEMWMLFASSSEKTP